MESYKKIDESNLDFFCPLHRNEYVSPTQHPLRCLGVADVE